MIKKDYHEKDVANHLFRRRKKEKELGTLRSKISLILLFLTGLAWFRFILYAPQFSIQNLDFTGTDKILAEKLNIALKNELDSHKFFIFNKNNYFTFNEIKFRQRLEEMFILSELEITKKFPNTVIVKAKEKVTSLILIINNEAHFVDYNGMVISDTPETLKTATLDGLASQMMPLVELKNTTNTINARTNIFDKNMVTTILEIYEKLNKEGIGVNSLIMEDPKNIKITVKSRDGFLIYMTTEDTIQNQIDNLKIILKEKIGEDRTKLNYIDLRFGDKVYYK